MTKSDSTNYRVQKDLSPAWDGDTTDERQQTAMFEKEFTLSIPWPWLYSPTLKLSALGMLTRTNKELSFLYNVPFLILRNQNYTI